MNAINIPSSFYRKIVAVMPIPCVDAVIVSGGKFLLGKRSNKPAQGKWWLPGGRVRKGETLVKAIHRKVREETGFNTMRIVRMLGTDQTMFSKSAFGSSAHTINTVFLVTVPSRMLKRHDFQHQKFSWFVHINTSWHPYIRTMLKEAGFKKENRVRGGHE